jgi:hypothetical protein
MRRLTNNILQVAQERYLSTRIMHFTRKTLFWQCMESFSNETYPDGLPDYVLGMTYISSELEMKKLVHESQRICPGDAHPQDGILVGWKSFIKSYSRCALTKESDIFVALQGITQDVVVDTLRDRMIAGLLESRLREELCWYVERHYWYKRLGTPHRPQKWRAPSWSWASVKLPISMVNDDPGDSRHYHCTVNRCHAPTKPSGELIEHEALLWMECQLLSLKIEFTGSEYTIVTPEIAKQSFSRINIYMDHPRPLERHAYARSVHLLALYSVDQSLMGLLLVPDGDGSDRFRRIGFIRFYFSEDAQSGETALYKLKHILGISEEVDTRMIELV